MQWTIKTRDREEDDIGFIYKITNLNNNKFYIGCKKLQRKIVRKPLKGKKRKRRELKESDWENYWSSSLDLNNDVEILGKENFRREIIEFVKSQWMLKYRELVWQLKYDVMNPKTNSYNGIINVRLCKTGELIWEKEK
jgi:hypothetical protein